MILSVSRHAGSLSARPRQYRLLTTLMYDAITKLIKASSRNTVAVEVEGWRGGASARPLPWQHYRLLISSLEWTVAPLLFYSQQQTLSSCVESLFFSSVCSLQLSDCGYGRQFRKNTKKEKHKKKRKTSHRKSYWLYYRTKCYNYESKSQHSRHNLVCLSQNLSVFSFTFI